MTEERRVFIKEITVRVPKEDQGEKHERLVEVDKEILEVTAEKRESGSQFNKQLKDLRAEQKALLDVIETGEETREVECYEEVDEQRLEMVTKRCDTGEVLVEYNRPLTAEERQMRLGEAEDEDDSDPGDEAA